VARGVHLPPDAGGVVWSVDARILLMLQSGKAPVSPSDREHHACA